MAYEMTFAYTEPGYCRVYYRGRSGRLYCVQEEMTGVYEFYGCIEDEPCTPASPKGCTFETIPDASEYDKGFMKYLEANGAVIVAKINPEESNG